MNRQLCILFPRVVDEPVGIKAKNIAHIPKSLEAVREWSLSNALDIQLCISRQLVGSENGILFQYTAVMYVQSGVVIRDSEVLFDEQSYLF